MRVVVVGAGLAGLAAAEALGSGAAEVVVLEARDRVGGRVRSHAFADGATVELGAEFVLPGNEVLRRIATRLGLSLYEKGTLYGDREPRRGPPVTRAELAAAVARLPEARGASVASALEALALSAGAREAIAARIEISAAHPVADLEASVLGETGAGFGAFASYGIAGGNQALAEALARRVRVQLSSPVRRVGWDERGVRVDGLDADACVVAVPASVTGAIDFDPPLPEWKRRALEAVRYGDAAKLFLRLARPAAPSATLAVPERFWTYTQRAPDGSSLPVAASFAGTRAALERLEVDAGPARWAALVRELRPDLALADEEPLLSTWSDDPWARGAYSARSLASPPDDAALAARVGPLAFAGEHTAGAWHALMEGALRSGERAAADVLERARIRS